MISIVVVSHSRALAEAAVALASEMITGDERPRVAVAAGLDESTFGTNAAAVAEAITEVDTPDGVLVLLDLGSAILSAEMALEFVEPDVAGRVRLSSAPLVEGLVAAVVLASTGADLDAVTDEAESGLVPKRSHLGSAATVSETGADGTPDAPADEDSAVAAAATAEVTVSNAHGLHARPAAKVVSLVREFEAQVMLTNLDTGRGPVNAGSLSAVATLNARSGNRLRVEASGDQADEAVHALEELAARGFDDQPAAGSAAPRSERAAGSGLDLAMGPALVRKTDVDTSAYQTAEPETESRRSREAVATVRSRLHDQSRRSREAVATVRSRLHDLERRTSEESGAQASAILAAQVQLLDDPDITGPVDAEIAAGISAVEAWSRRLDEVAARFEGLTDAYQRERAADVRSVRAAVLRALTGQPDEDLDVTGAPVILVVDELDAATAASIDATAVAGVVTVARGTTGHGVIVAASRGIPLLTGVGDDAAGVRTGQVVAFDARTDAFLPEVSEADQRRFADLVAERARERIEVVEAARWPALTGDGHRVPVLANVASLADADSARANGAEGSGLVRTEVLFGDRAEAPTVEEQTETFLALAEAMGGASLTIRTWDVGGDKPLPFLPMPREANPFLGARGIRAFRRQPRLLYDQLTAICRAARETPIRVMFPMVSNAGEVATAVAQLRHAAAIDAVLVSGERSTGFYASAETGSQAAAEAGSAVPEGLDVGIMVEVPAAALTIETLAEGLDFVSVGTNDLTQYTMAADRGNDAVAELADPLSPAVLRLIDRVCRRAPDGVEVAVCGDLASQPRAVPLLLGLGVRELSCTPPKVPDVKAAVRGTDLADARALAAEVLTAGEPAEIRELL